MIPISEIVSHGVRHFLKRKFAFQSDRSDAELALLKERYKVWGAVFVGVALLLMFTLPFLYAYLSFHIYEFCFNQFINSGVAFYAPGWITFVIFGFFICLATLFMSSEWVMKLLLRERYDEFEDYYNSNQQYDNHKAGVWLGKGCFVLALIVMPFTFNQYIFLKKDGVVIKGIAHFSKRNYKYNEVKRVAYYKNTQARDGSIRASPIYKVLFADGYTFLPLFYFSNINEAAPFIQALSTNTKMPIDTIEVSLFK